MYCIILYAVWKHREKRTSNSLYIDDPTLRMNIRQTDIIMCIIAESSQNSIYIQWCGGYRNGLLKTGLLLLL